MKILAVCGHGLGSSFMLEMNIKNVLTELGVDAEVGHTTLIDVSSQDADLFIVGEDLKEATQNLGNVVTLKSIIDTSELKEKLSVAIADK